VLTGLLRRDEIGGTASSLLGAADAAEAGGAGAGAGSAASGAGAGAGAAASASGLSTSAAIRAAGAAGRTLLWPLAATPKRGAAPSAPLARLAPLTWPLQPLTWSVLVQPALTHIRRRATLPSMAL